MSIIMPAFNEEGNIVAAISGVLHAIHQANITDYEVIVVDDGSTDATGEHINVCEEAWSGIRVHRHSPNRGLREAYECALKSATKPYVTWVPGDGEMASASIADILLAIGTADLVIPYHGTPERRGWFRRLLTWGSTTQLNLLLGHNLRYYQGTVCLETSLARSLPRTESGFFFCAEMLAHALDRGCSYVEVPLIHTDRAHGVSKAVSLRAIWKAQKLIARLWWRLRVRTAFEALGFALEVGR